MIELIIDTKIETDIKTDKQRERQKERGIMEVRARGMRKMDGEEKADGRGAKKGGKIKIKRGDDSDLSGAFYSYVDYSEPGALLYRL